MMKRVGWFWFFMVVIGFPLPLWATFDGAGDENFVFLPILSKPVVVVPPAPIANGDFENGRIAWEEFSSHNFQLIITGGAIPPPIDPHSGVWLAYLAGAHNETSIIQQTITIPPQTPYLHYWYWNDSIEQPCGFFDVGRVVVVGNTVDMLDLCGNTRGWLERVVNLSSYAGQTVLLQIMAETDGVWHSNLFIEDVSLQASGR